MISHLITADVSVIDCAVAANSDDGARGNSLQEDCVDLGGCEVYPWPHDVQSVFSVLLKVPAEHSVHTDSPVEAETKPGLQPTQLVCPDIKREVEAMIMICGVDVMIRDTPRRGDISPASQL